jgi:transcriptional regulator with XRE-family HTH domain
MSELGATIAKRVRLARENERYTQTDIANELGITRSAYANIELNRNIIGVEHLVNLARFYNVDVNWFLGEGPDEPQDPVVARLDKALAALSRIERSLSSEDNRPRQSSALDEILIQLPEDDIREILLYARHRLSLRTVEAADEVSSEELRSAAQYLEKKRRAQEEDQP